MKLLRLFSCTIIVCLSLLTASNAKTFRQSLWGIVPTFDPVYSTTTENITLAGNLFEPLVILGQNGEILPGQAQSWKISEDKLTYTFKLYDNLKWSDGHPLTAHDFVRAFQRLVDPDVNEHRKPNYVVQQIKNAKEIAAGSKSLDSLGVRAIDDQNLVIELNQPSSFLLAVLTYSALGPVPSHRIDEVGEVWSSELPLVSNGPLKLVKYENETLYLEKNQFNIQPIDYDKMTMKIYEDRNKVLRDFAIGQLDFAQDLSKKQDEWMRDIKSGRFIEETLSGLIYLAFNLEDEKFQDKKVRLALALAIDRQFLVKSLGYGRNQAATLFTPPTLLKVGDVRLPEAFNQPFEKRQQRVIQLLEEAGYNSENPLEIELIAQDKYEIDRIGLLLRSMWTAVGVKVSLVNASKVDLYDKLFPGPFEVGIGTWFADYPEASTFLNIHRSNSVFNLSRWKNDAFDTQLDLAISELDAEIRDNYYRALEQIILDDLPIVPLVYPSASYLVSDRVESIVFDGDINVTARDVSIGSGQ